jgi:hypothetical protein
MDEPEKTEERRSGVREGATRTGRGAGCCSTSVSAIDSVPTTETERERETIYGIQRLIGRQVYLEGGGIHFREGGGIVNAALASLHRGLRRNLRKHRSGRQLTR